MVKRNKPPEPRLAATLPPPDRTDHRRGAKRGMQEQEVTRGPRNVADDNADPTARRRRSKTRQLGEHLDVSGRNQTTRPSVHVVVVIASCTGVVVVVYRRPILRRHTCDHCASVVRVVGRVPAIGGQLHDTLFRLVAAAPFRSIVARRGPACGRQQAPPHPYSTVMPGKRKQNTRCCVLSNCRTASSSLL